MNKFLAVKMSELLDPAKAQLFAEMVNHEESDAKDLRFVAMGQMFASDGVLVMAMTYGKRGIGDRMDAVSPKDYEDAKKEQEAKRARAATTNVRPLRPIAPQGPVILPDGSGS